MKYDKDKRNKWKREERKETFNFGCNRCVLCNIMPWKIKPTFLFFAFYEREKAKEKNF